MKMWVKTGDNDEVTTIISGPSVVPQEDWDPIDMSDALTREMLSSQDGSRRFRKSRGGTLSRKPVAHMESDVRQILANGTDEAKITVSGDIPDNGLRIRHGRNVSFVTADDPLVVTAARAGVITIREVDPRVFTRPQSLTIIARGAP